MISRRQFIPLLGGAASAWPMVAGAQQSGKLPTVGFLGSSTPSVMSRRIAALTQRLRELGWIEGRTVAFEIRWAEGRTERYAEIAEEFVRLKVDVILTSGDGAVLAAKGATSTIPIVFAAAADPVRSGLVASLARPGSNVTGLSLQSTDLAGKRVEVLREVVSGLRRLAIMANVGVLSGSGERDNQEAQSAARNLGLKVITLDIRRVEDIVSAFNDLEGRAQALYVAPSPFLTAHRIRINTLATGARLPTMYAFREYVEAGGLVSYGANFLILFRQAAEIVDKILRGAKPADIPVAQPTKFELVVNLIAARAIRLTVPPSLLARADEVIE
jgi:putative ABC transport system substrate-binding protein